MNVKKGVKRTASLVVFCYIIMLLAMPLTSVSAADSKVLSDNMMLDLKTFSILQGDENGDLNLDQELTRAELSKVVAKVLQIQDVNYPENYGQIYHDVPSSHWAFGYITMLSGLGLLNGDPDGNFYPDNIVTYEETVKVLVCMLGFGIEAEELGGYPNGYIASGNKRGVTYGVTVGSTEGINRETAMRMVYNCLDADRLVAAYGGDTKAEISSKTFRDLLMGDKEEGLMEVEGVVSANFETYLWDARPEMEEWQVEVDGVLYDKGETDIDKQIGKKVKMYAEVNQTSKYPVVKNYEVLKDNTELTLDFEDVSSLTNTEVQYAAPDTGKNAKKTIALDAVFVYNGRKILGMEDVKFSEMEDGSVTLISNERSAAVNVVFINEYESFTVDSVNETDKRIYLSDDDRFQNAKYINLDMDKYDIVAVLMNAKGEKQEIKSVEAGDIISVFGSLDGNLVRIYDSKDVIDGTVNQLNTTDKTVTIDDTAYQYEKGIQVEDLIGKSVTAKLNFAGGIAEIKKETGVTSDYGAIVGLSLESGVSEVLYARMAIPGKIMDDIQEVDPSDDPTKDDIPAIAAQNKDVVTIPFASKVRFKYIITVRTDDGRKVKQEFNETLSGAALKDTIERVIVDVLNIQLPEDPRYLVVSYTTNSNGEIKSMEALEYIKYPIAAGENEENANYTPGMKQYNAYEKTFGKTSGGAFGLDDSTLALCVPDTALAGPDDIRARISMNNGQQYYVEAYAYNEDTHAPDLILFKSEMHYDTPGSIDAKSKLGLVEDVMASIDEDGEPVKSVMIATPDGINTYIISDETSSEADFGSLRRGALIAYSLDSKDRMDGYSLIIDCDPVPDPEYYNTPEKELYIGEITNVRYKQVYEPLNKWADIITISIPGLGDKTYGIQRTNTPPIYIYDTYNNSVSLGTSSDFLSDSKRAVVYSSYNVVKAVVIIQ